MGQKNSKNNKQKSKNLKNFKFDEESADMPKVEEFKDESPLDNMIFIEDESRVSSHSVSMIRFSQNNTFVSGQQVPRFSDVQNDTTPPKIVRRPSVLS